MPRSIQVGVPSGWVLSILIVVLPLLRVRPDASRGHRHFRSVFRIPAVELVAGELPVLNDQMN